MIRVSVLYPGGDGTQFDMKYYLENHTPMLKARLGPALRAVTIDHGIGGGAPGTPATYVVTCTLAFDSVDTFQAAFSPHAAEILGDIANYTNVQPVIQIGEAMM